MINPELIAGMLFLPSMKKNEAIEIIGAERFSNYTGLVKGVPSTIHFPVSENIHFLCLLL